MIVRLVTYNIRFGGRGRGPLIANVLGPLEADLVVLQEATDRATVDRLASDLGLAVADAEQGASVAVLSRIRVDSVARHRLLRGRSFVELRLSGPDVRVYAVHLSSGLSRRGESRRMTELGSILRTIGDGPEAARAMIVGDLNAISPSDRPTVSMLPTWIRLLLRVDGGIRSEVMTAVASRQFGDAYRILHPTDPGPTMPAADPSVRLDYVLLGPALVQDLVGCGLAHLEPSLLVRASDHLPVVAELDL